MSRLLLLCMSISFAAVALFCSIAADSTPTPRVIHCFGTDDEPAGC